MEIVIKVCGAPPQNPSHIVDSRSGRKHVSKARGHTDLDHWMKRQTSVDFGKKQNILAQKGRGRAYRCVRREVSYDMLNYTVIGSTGRSISSRTWVGLTFILADPTYSWFCLG